MIFYQNGHTQYEHSIPYESFKMQSKVVYYAKRVNLHAIRSRLKRMLLCAGIYKATPRSGQEENLIQAIQNAESALPYGTLQDAADRYIDLMIRILTNTIYEDTLIVPSQSSTFDRKRRDNGQDWPAQAHTMVGTLRLRNLAQLVDRTLQENIPGDYIETGVWRGGCSILMRAILAVRGQTGRRVYVADSFEGLPPPKPDLYPQDQGDMHHSYPQLAVSLEQVKANFARYGLLDEQVVFVKGYFDQTLPKLDAGPFALLRLDGDMYESTIVALESLYPRLSPGGFIIIDDYALKGCRLAVDDYRKAHGIREPLEMVDWTGAWWRKPLAPMGDNGDGLEIAAKKPNQV